MPRTWPPMAAIYTIAGSGIIYTDALGLVINNDATAAAEDPYIVMKGGTGAAVASVVMENDSNQDELAIYHQISGAQLPNASTDTLTIGDEDVTNQVDARLRLMASSGGVAATAANLVWSPLADTLTLSGATTTVLGGNANVLGLNLVVNSDATTALERPGVFLLGGNGFAAIITSMVEQRSDWASIVLSTTASGVQQTTSLYLGNETSSTSRNSRLFFSGGDGTWNYTSNITWTAVGGVRSMGFNGALFYTFDAPIVPAGAAAESAYAAGKHGYFFDIAAAEGSGNIDITVKAKFRVTDVYVIKGGAAPGPATSTVRIQNGANPITAIIPLNIAVDSKALATTYDVDYWDVAAGGTLRCVVDATGGGDREATVFVEGYVIA